MLNELLKIIESNCAKYYMKSNPFSYETLKIKRREFIALGMELGCHVDVFEDIFDISGAIEKFSAFSRADWGFFSPSVLDNHIVKNRKKVRRLSNKRPINEADYLKYYIDNDRLVKLEVFFGTKCYSTTYLCYVGNVVYSFKFYSEKKNKIEIIEVIYDDNNNIMTFAKIETYGIPEDDTDKIMFYQCKNGVRAALLEYQDYHYEDGKLLFVDKYDRMYEFSPQIAGYRFGERWNFVYDENDTVIDTVLDGIKPCIFEG